MGAREGGVSMPELRVVVAIASLLSVLALPPMLGGEDFAHSGSLLNSVAPLMAQIFADPTFARFREVAALLGTHVELDLPRLLRPPFVWKGDPTAIVCVNAPPVSVTVPHDDPNFYHPPPPAVSAMLGCRSCVQGCRICSSLGHDACPACPLKSTPGDKSLRVVVNWQRERLW